MSTLLSIGYWFVDVTASLTTGQFIFAFMGVIGAIAVSMVTILRCFKSILKHQIKVKYGYVRTLPRHNPGDSIYNIPCPSHLDENSIEPMQCVKFGAYRFYAKKGQPITYLGVNM